jgi:hypothetical protein
MKLHRRRLLLAVAPLTLVLTTLSLDPSTTPAVQAASPPSITVDGQGGGVLIYGGAFTPGARVRVELLDTNLTVLETGS